MANLKLPVSLLLPSSSAERKKKAEEREKGIDPFGYIFWQGLLDRS